MKLKYKATLDTRIRLISNCLIQALFTKIWMSRYSSLLIDISQQKETDRMDGQKVVFNRHQDVKGRPDRRQKENCCTKTRFHILMWKVQPYLRLNERWVCLNSQLSMMSDMTYDFNCQTTILQNIYLDFCYFHVAVMFLKSYNLQHLM